ncbi:LuxR family transcriptional regulator [Skermania sp. ID1734]|uniref:helix-turn-helix transcriptional regulator n=1 Tax=Skermania sp. ID1734 TaxID=2597516 RepID=UPI00118172E6|nr:LuxR family transcriptional regulator [Skermania sp. ID1734]TSE01570.1 LuxR family transcriptional regulator [Skermania sp. ID1734]
MTASGPLVGRRHELDRLEAMLGSGSALIAVVGAAGMGKTALLEYFRSTHAELPSAAAVGTAWEADHPFGVIEQLTKRSTAGAVDRVARELVADGMPALILVDDAHRADVESMQALASAAWLTDRPLLVVAAYDAGAAMPTALRGLLDGVADRIVLPPLTVSDVLELAHRTARIELSPPRARALVDHTSGIPRHLVAILTETPRRDWEGWQSALPVPKGVAAEIESGLAECSAHSRALVEAAAVLGEPASLAEVAELGKLDDPIAAADEAGQHFRIILRERNGDNVIEFRSPLQRAAVLAAMGPIRRRELHLRAAKLTTDHGAELRHRAAAQALPDAALAAEFERHAAEQADVGAWSAAADALITASRLSTDRADRERRLIRAVDAIVGAGNLPRAKEFAPDLERFASGPLRDAVLGYLAIQLGRNTEADALLRQAWAKCDPDADPEIAAMICQRRVLDALSRCHATDLVEWSRRAIALVKRDDPAAVESAAILGLGLAASGRADEARVAYADLAVVRGAQTQRFRMGKGWLDLALDDPEAARHELEYAVPTVFRSGSVRISVWAGAWLARTYFALGGWDDALRTVERTARLLDDVGMDLVRPLVHWTGAQINALRGNWDAADEHLRRLSADRHDYQIMFIPAAIARAQCAEVQADYAGVIRALEPVTRLEMRDGIDEPGFWPWPDIYCNALVMVGRVDDADRFLRPHEATAQARQHRSASARLGYVRGRILGARNDIDRARKVFEGSLQAIADLPLPYDRARINFAYGQTLRRAGKRRAADAVMHAARDAYASLGATSYVQRCDRELKAGGLNMKRSADPLADLTPQEQAVAALVARGASNKEAAEELFLSVKTVQYHLTRVYAKVGVRTRSQLATVLNG